MTYYPTTYSTNELEGKIQDKVDGRLFRFDIDLRERGSGRITAFPVVATGYAEMVRKVRVDYPRRFYSIDKFKAIAA